MENEKLTTEELETEINELHTRAIEETTKLRDELQKSIEVNNKLIDELAKKYKELDGGQML
ncbi:MAG: hypothetical protein U9R19_08255 [Bacteroidota bacterium]|nr:hypothetical protein [Bacteroidota bacterium]